MTKDLNLNNLHKNDDKVEEIKKRKEMAKKNIEAIEKKDPVNDAADTENTSLVPETKTEESNPTKMVKFKKRERVGFSFKLDAEDADKLITYHMYTGTKLSELIEDSILKALKKEKVEVDNALVQEYHERKENKRKKAEENKEIRKKLKEFEKELRNRKSN